MATLLKLSETRWLHTDTVTLIRQEGEQWRVWRGRAPHMPGAPPALLGEQECFDDRLRSSLGRLRDWNLPQGVYPREGAHVCVVSLCGPRCWRAAWR